jgi:hypothetical protein
MASSSEGSGAYSSEGPRVATASEATEGFGTAEGWENKKLNVIMLFVDLS